VKNSKNIAVLVADHCGLLSLKMTVEAMLKPLLQLFFLFFFCMLINNTSSIV